MNYWIIPCRKEYYDIDEYFAKYTKISWRQKNNNISEGDIVYIYVALPDARIKYRCVVEKVKIENNEEMYNHKDDDEYWKDVDNISSCDFFMNMRLIKKYDNSIDLSYEKLKTLGVRSTIQSQITAPEAMVNYIEYTIIDLNNDATYYELVNKKRIKSKNDWIGILKNEKQEDNIVLEILFYMMGCRNRTSNGLNIKNALKLNNVPNAEIVGFGKRIVKLKDIPEQDGEHSKHRYWNIPFETVSELNNEIFTWKIRDELAEALIELYDIPSNGRESIQKDFEDYEESMPITEYENRISEDLKTRNEFVKKYAVKDIMKLKLEDYVTGRSTIDNNGKNAFCYLLESKMRQLGDMRGATADKFGVYYSKNGKYEYSKKYGSSLEIAFKKIKEEICNLIVAGNNDDYEAMDKSMLPPLFKGKLLSTYYPDKYLCVFKEDFIDKFLYYLGISYEPKEINTIEKKKTLLKKYKDTNKSMSNYSNFYFVAFLCDLFRKELKEKNTVNGQIIGDVEVVDFEYKGGHISKNRNTYRSRETDYEKINRNKKDIGNRGEIKVLQYEKEKLNQLELYDLAKKVELTENDAIGYDIISYDKEKNEIHIEVKTNSGSGDNFLEFYITQNEIQKMMNDSQYNIYYLYSIKDKPKMHIINKETLLKNREQYFQPVLYKVSIDVEKKK